MESEQALAAPDRRRGVTRWCSLDEAAASIPDGAWLAPRGFMLGRAPLIGAS
jgi:hypothetical protein